MGSSRRRRYSPERIVRRLRGADRLLGEGQEVVVVAKQLEVSEQTLRRWRAP
jgi:putative transposase